MTISKTMGRMALATGILGAALTPALADTVEQHYAFLHAKCGSVLKLNKSACDCIVTTAKADLKGKELDVVVLMIKQDNAGINKMQSDLSREQMGNAVSFVTQTPSKCSNK